VRRGFKIGSSECEVYKLSPAKNEQGDGEKTNMRLKITKITYNTRNTNKVRLMCAYVRTNIAQHLTNFVQPWLNKEVDDPSFVDVRQTHNIFRSEFVEIQDKNEQQKSFSDYHE